MAEIVGQGQAFGQILVQADDARHRAGDLRNLEAVGQAGAVIVALVIDENLGLVFQLAEGFRVDDAVAVALKGRSGVAFRFRMSASPALLGMAGERGQERQVCHGAGQYGKSLGGSTFLGRRAPWAIPTEEISI